MSSPRRNECKTNSEITLEFINDFLQIFELAESVKAGEINF